MNNIPKFKEVHLFVLMTDGPEFIGSPCVETLLAVGARARVLDALSTGYHENPTTQHVALEFVQGNVRDQTGVASCMSNIKHVLHLTEQISVPIFVQQPMHSHSPESVIQNDCM